MDKINFNLNDYLRFAFAGGWFVFSLILVYVEDIHFIIAKPDIGNSIGLILISLIIGSLIYSIHRAIMFPHFYKLMLLLFRIRKKIGKDNSVFIPFVPSKLEVELDIRRWKSRKNDNSIIKNLVEWSSQIHFLYCTSWAMLFAIFTARYLGGFNEKMLWYVKVLFWVVFCASIISHYRIFVFDVKIHEEDKVSPLP